jgi:hypothetical protein
MEVALKSSSCWVLHDRSVRTLVHVTAPKLAHRRLTMNFLRRVLGGGAPAASSPQEPAPAADEKAKEEEPGPVCVFPDDVPFDESPCLLCEQPCASHKQVRGGIWR